MEYSCIARFIFHGINRAAIALVLLAYAASGQAELKDPRTRDEDISATVIESRVEELPDGAYEYTYDLTFPRHNKGTARYFTIDVSCHLAFEMFPVPKNRQGAAAKLTFSSHHVPVWVQAPQVISVGCGGSDDNQATWTIWDGEPGTVKKGLRIVSPAPPTLRDYELEPHLEFAGWDYADLETDPAVKWVGDFLIDGVIEAPACASASPESAPRYHGYRPRHRIAKRNDLLTYSAPLNNRWHIHDKEPAAVFEIHYAAEMDPASFSVEPEWAREYFHPAAGESEEVAVPMKPGKSRIRFEAAVAGEQGRSPEGLDVDEFEIRAHATDAQE